MKEKKEKRELTDDESRIIVQNNDKVGVEPEADVLDITEATETDTFDGPPAL